MGFFDRLFKGVTQEEEFEESRVADTEFADEEFADAEFAAEDDATLRLREEELEIRKDRVTTGEVVLHKDIVEEQQRVAVPVAHDEVVIERRVLDHSPSSEPIAEEETVHIPVTAERVDVDKRTVVREEISAHKREIEETECVDEVLHKEVAHVETDGDAVVTETDAYR
ncbi:YsnF/AvaK domain-containing protein [Paenibacillus sp.]|uniref:YsnF/AvaK domain-containing protein n=1 Tax=Paenibacillus sp. TaxID=58172 RepID=UPI0028113C6F|nr:YsnF/AvaK domain-containing protein [Paenibacillus sp.]